MARGPLATDPQPPANDVPPLAKELTPTAVELPPEATEKVPKALSPARVREVYIDDETRERLWPT